MEAVDKSVPQPARELDKPFLMPIEDIFSISGRGTVVTGRIERGKVKVGEEVEIVGFRDRLSQTAGNCGMGWLIFLLLRSVYARLRPPRNTDRNEGIPHSADCDWPHVGPDVEFIQLGNRDALRDLHLA